MSGGFIMFREEQTDALRATLDSFLVPMFTVDLSGDGRVRVAGHNAAFEAFTGFPLENDLGKEVHQLMLPEDADYVTALNFRCARARKPVSHSMIVRVPNGEHQHFTRLLPVIPDAGEVTRIVGVTSGQRLHKPDEPGQIVDEGVTTLAPGLAASIRGLRPSLGAAVQDGADLPSDDWRLLGWIREIAEAALDVSTRLQAFSWQRRFAVTPFPSLLADGKLGRRVLDIIHQRKAP